MYRLLLTSFLFVLAAAAIAPKAAETPKSTAPATEKPDESKSKAQTSAPDMRKATDDNFSKCMSNWEAATHMTKTEWARACRRSQATRKR